MGRIRVIDGLRGACLVFMTISHLEFGRAYLLGYLHFKQLGFADSAQGFIFLSGLLVGLLGMRQHARGGLAAVMRRNHRRALELYGWHLGLVLLILFASRLLPDAWTAWGDWLSGLFEDGPVYATATAGLLYQPTFLDILPQYILYLLAAPFVVHLVATGRTGHAAALTLVSWLAAQAGLLAGPVGWIGQHMAAVDHDFVLRAAFDPLGWQLPFAAGLIIGALVERGDLRPETLFPAGGRFLPQLAFGVLAGFLAIRLAIRLDLLSPSALERIGDIERHQTLGLLPALNFAALAYAVGWLVAAAPEQGTGLARRLGLALRHLLQRPRLVVLGRHSLPVFAFHVVLMYALRYLDARLGVIPDPWFSLMALAALASLFLVAAGLEAQRTAGNAQAAATPS